MQIPDYFNKVTIIDVTWLRNHVYGHTVESIKDQIGECEPDEAELLFEMICGSVICSCINGHCMKDLKIKPPYIDMIQHRSIPVKFFGLNINDIADDLLLSLQEEVNSIAFQTDSRVKFAVASNMLILVVSVPRKR